MIIDISMHRNVHHIDNLSSETLQSVKNTKQDMKNNNISICNQNNKSRPRLGNLRNNCNDSSNERLVQIKKSSSNSSIAKNKSPRKINKRDIEEIPPYSYLKTFPYIEQRLGKYLNSEILMPKLYKILELAKIGSYREIEELIIAGRISINGEPAHVTQRVAQGDLIRINGQLITQLDIKNIPRIILYYQSITSNSTENLDNFQNNNSICLPKLRNGKWIPILHVNQNIEGLLIYTTSSDITDRIYRFFHQTDQEYLISVANKIDTLEAKSLINESTINNKLISLNDLDQLGYDGNNYWYRVILRGNPNFEINSLFEKINSITINRSIRTRLGNLVLPYYLRQGHWNELKKTVVAALMIQLGLLKNRYNPERIGKNRSRQPESHDSALPPGFGTIKNNGTNGARLNKIGSTIHSYHQDNKILRKIDKFSSDPFCTGLMINGGYANGYPITNDNSAKFKRNKNGFKNQNFSEKGTINSHNYIRNLQTKKITKTTKMDGNKKNLNNKYIKSNDAQPREPLAHESCLPFLYSDKDKNR